MSYILEALKKAEQARLAAKLPDIKSIALSAELPIRESPPWLYAATFAGVVAGATGLGWWFTSEPHDKPLLEKATIVSLSTGSDVPREPMRNSIPSTSASELPRVAIPPEAASSNALAESVTPLVNPRHVAPMPVALESKSRGLPDVTEKVAAVVASPRDDFAAIPSASDRPMRDKKIQSRRSEPAIVAPVEVPDLKSTADLHVFRLDELPPEVRRHVPKINTTGYVYSPDAEVRVVSINERSLREGDELISGLRLEQIAQDFLLFSFRGYRFRVEMF